MPDLIIEIVSSGSDGEATFDPNLLQAQQGDSAFWSNTTNNTHQPWPTDANYNPLSDAAVNQNPALYMTDPIPAGATSSIYDCGTLGPTYYYCKLHPNETSERGSILVTAPPSQLPISISVLGSGKTAFDPAIQGANQDDLVYWTNTTSDTHQPWPTDANYNPLQVSSGSPKYLCDEIPPGEFSQTYEVAQPGGNPPPQAWTVYYYCKLHPKETSERGTIVVPPPS